MYPRAKKNYSQNFLKDESVIQKIVEAAEIIEGETVLEIGPGTGVLTSALIDAGAKVVAVEADESLINNLEEVFEGKATIVHSDILSVIKNEEKQKELGFSEGGYKLVANLPYSITSSILEQFLVHAPRPSKMIVMVQREVADRITAKPGEMSVLSVMCQLYAKCKKVTNVKAGSFVPAPKVDSAVVQFVLREDYSYNPEYVISLAKAGFSARRKQLHHNLSAGGYGKSEWIKKVLEKMGIDPRVRAQELSPEQWVKLSGLLDTK
jgi:16S rRNA (adenine1518-N6/adenine1519-N6)-dimethyltransferase